MRWILTLLLGMLAACAHAENSPAPPAIEKRIALSFDDVPRAPGAFLGEDERTRLLIESLAQAGVDQAAFFVNPGQIDGEDDVRRIDAYVAAGHVIANHTATHPHLSQTGLDTYLADIDAADRWLRGRDGFRPWFRFPFLDEGADDKEKRDGVRAALAERGLVNGYVTVDASDWFYEGAAKDAAAQGKPIDREALRDLYVTAHVDAAEFYDGIARQAWGRSPAHMLLLHETDLAALWIGDLVAALRAKGWTIVSADEVFADPIAADAATYDTPYAQGTLTEAVAWQRGVPAPRWYEYNNTDKAAVRFHRQVLGEDSAPEQDAPTQD
tara:strand:- start:273 stop:1250 length:978 start_codon:yes stop_codon:yes gene_type:complete